MKRTDSFPALLKGRKRTTAFTQARTLRPSWGSLRVWFKNRWALHVQN